MFDRQQSTIANVDPAIWAAIQAENLRQEQHIELIASENYCSPAVMAAQLERVLRETERPNVTVQVIPYSVGAHPALDSNFRILEFAGPASDLIYSEGMVGFIYLDRPEDIARYHECFEHLSQIALKPDRSAELILQISQAYDASVRTAS